MPLLKNAGPVPFTKRTRNYRTRVKKSPKKPKKVLQKCIMDARDLLPSLLATYEAILQHVDKLGDVTLTWEKFTQVWKELKCVTIYYDVHWVLRRYALMEFTEEALTMAKDLWLGQSELKKQIAAFFLLSAMFLQQPFRNPQYFVHIVLKVGEGDKFHKFCKELERANCDEALQVVLHMWELYAFSFRATRYVYGLEPMYQLSLLRDHEKSHTPAAVEYTSPNMEMLKELGDVVGEYLKLKQVITPAGGKSRHELSYIDENTFQLLQSCVVPKEAGMPPEESRVPTEEPEPIETRRKRIKKKVFQKGCVSSKSAQVVEESSVPTEDPEPIETRQKRIKKTAFQKGCVPSKSAQVVEESSVPTEDPEPIETRRKRIKKKAFQKGCVSSKSAEVVEESSVPTEDPEPIETRRKRIKKKVFQKGCVPSKSAEVEPKKELQ